MRFFGQKSIKINKKICFLHLIYLRAYIKIFNLSNFKPNFTFIGLSFSLETVYLNFLSLFNQILML